MLRAALILGVWLAGGAARADPFSDYLAPPLPADGFDAPGEARAGAPVRALAAGTVKEGSAAELVLEHAFYENAELRRARSRYRWVTRPSVKPGQQVARGAVLGTHGPCAAAPELEGLRHGARLPASLPLPAQEPQLLLIHPASRQLRLYARGKEVKRYEVGFGQADGPKRERGDLRTPSGMYFLLEKSRGPFAGPAAAFYGGYWARLNYPNAFDAERGLKAGLIRAEEAAAISAAWRARKPTNEKTRLGGGIGLHGWAGEWRLSETEGRMSWGCVVFHTADLAELYPVLQPGAMVVILP